MGEATRMSRCAICPRACADWHMAMHMYYVGVCPVWMHVPPSVMATTATKDMYACPDASLPRRAQGLVAEEDEPVLWRDMWASSQTSLLARGRGVSGERRNARMDVDESGDAALGKSVTPSLMCWQLPSPVVFANRWGLGRSTTNVHTLWWQRDAPPNHYCKWPSPHLK